VKVGSVTIGGGCPIVVQSMCATKTADVEATTAQVNQLAEAGAGVVRIAVDTPRDCEALREIRQRTRANLSVDLQENYRLAADVAPWVDKIRYNPGHLYHHERNRPWQDKVRFLVDVAGQHDCALRVGVNCGSVDPAKSISPLPLGEGLGVRAAALSPRPSGEGPQSVSPLPSGEGPQSVSPRPLGEGPGVRAAVSGQRPVASGQYANRHIPNLQSPIPNPQSLIPRLPALTLTLSQEERALAAMLESALEHCDLLDRLGFTRYCVSLKDSDPTKVIAVNRQFAAERPDVPLHLGVTEAGMPPEGILKTWAAFQPLLSQGIGDTIRVSLTVPVARKHEEVEAGRQILADIAAGRRPGGMQIDHGRLNIISCPSCSRVENNAFVELAQRVREATRYAAAYPITIAVMGCRVNGPGETDHADLGLWCGPDCVHLKRGGTPLGPFSYEEVITQLQSELNALIAHHDSSKV
jgi:4-hydroxy-3-methylbut-2-en-1-yl diphosphate synthase IspG/GcpE